MIKLIKCAKCGQEVPSNMWNDHVCGTVKNATLDTTVVARDQKSIVADIVADRPALERAREKYNTKKPRKSICLAQEDWDELDRLALLNNTTRSGLISILLKEECSTSTSLRFAQSSIDC